MFVKGMVYQRLYPNIFDTFDCLVNDIVHKGNPATEDDQFRVEMSVIGHQMLAVVDDEEGMFILARTCNDDYLIVQHLGDRLEVIFDGNKMALHRGEPVKEIFHKLFMDEKTEDSSDLLASMEVHSVHPSSDWYTPIPSRKKDGDDKPFAELYVEWVKIRL